MNELIDFTELEKVLQEYAQEAEEVYKYQISLGGKNASRKLADTIKGSVVVGSSAYEVTLTLQEYWKFIEGGAKGTESSPPGAVYPAHFPPVGVIMNWISVKPIIPRPNEFGETPTPRQLAFLIGRKIKEEGIEPYPALETTKEELNKIYKEKIAKALTSVMSQYIRKLVATE